MFYLSFGINCLVLTSSVKPRKGK